MVIDRLRFHVDWGDQSPTLKTHTLCRDISQIPTNLAKPLRSSIGNATHNHSNKNSSLTKHNLLQQIPTPQARCVDISCTLKLQARHQNPAGILLAVPQTLVAWPWWWNSSTPARQWHSLLSVLKVKSSPQLVPSFEGPGSWFQMGHKGWFLIHEINM